MAQFNQVIFLGRLGRDPEMSYTPTGKEVTKCSVAISRPPKLVGREKQEQDPMWVSVTCWQKLAETVNAYGRKGSLVLVQGSFDLHAYTDRNKIERTAFEVTAWTVQFLEKKPDDAPGALDNPLGELEDHPF